MAQQLTADRVRYLFSYDEESGDLIRRITIGRHRAGEKAGGHTRNGYKSVSIDGKRYLVHRVAWLYVTGSWPVGEIDHINRVRDDNRMSNLRAVDHKRNCKNFPLSARSSSGLNGVSWCKRRKRWRAYLVIGGTQVSGGYWDSKDEAHKKRLEMDREYGFSETHGQPRDSEYRQLQEAA